MVVGYININGAPKYRVWFRDRYQSSETIRNHVLTRSALGGFRIAGFSPPDWWGLEPKLTYIPAAVHPSLSNDPLGDDLPSDITPLPSVPPPLRDAYGVADSSSN